MQNSFLFVLCLMAVALCLPASEALAQSLTSPQRSALRSARNAVITVKSQVDRMEYYIVEWRGMGSQVTDSRVQAFNNSSTQAIEAYKKAQEALAQLPADNSEVAAIATELQQHGVRHDKAIADARALIEGAKEAVEGMGGREAINADLERLDEISDQFSYFPNLLVEYPDQAAKLLTEFQPAVDEYRKFQAKYAEFLKVDNADTAPVKRKLTEVQNRLQKVVTSSREQVEQVRTMASNNLDMAEELIATGVRERKPLYFREDGGVPQQLEGAKQRVLLATAIDADAAAALVERFKQVKAKADEAGQSLKTEIIAGNKGPADNYQGSDRDAVLEGVRAAWLEANADDKIVEITIPTRDWKRETKWTWWRDAWYFTDSSGMQAAVVIEAQNEAGEMEYHYYPVNVTKDHENDDALSFSPWAKEPLNTLSVDRRILPENL